MEEMGLCDDFVGLRFLEIVLADKHPDRRYNDNHTTSISISNCLIKKNARLQQANGSISEGEKIGKTLVVDDIADSELGASCYTGPSELIIE